MIGIAWVLFLGFLFFIFEDAINARINPNQDITTNDLGYAREIVLQRNRQGHYVASGTINGSAVTFLLDTGATDIAIPIDVANRLRLEKGQPVIVKTANGNARAWRTWLDSVALGELERRDVRATILENIHGEEILLGMAYLKHFELVQRGSTLTIRQ